MPRSLRLELLEARLAPAIGIPKSFVIAIDGLRGDGILNANTPNLRSLVDGTWGDGPGVDYRGAYADYATTVRDGVTVSGPNHTTIYTGVTVVDHGVTGNNAAQMAAVTFPDYLGLLETNDPARHTAKIVSWDLDDLVPTGADYHRQVNDAANAQLAADIFAGVPGNAYAVATGTTAIDALFMFYDDLDIAGHAGGHTPGNPGYRAELEQIDGQIGLALNAIRNRPTFAQEDWQIVITSDHGGRYAGHGFEAADNYTIPFLVCSRSAGQGWLTGTPGNVDVMPTVLAHFGVPLPAYTDGVARGPNVRSFPATTLEQDRVANLKFDFNYLDSSGTANPINAAVGGGSPTFVAGKFGQAVSLNAATNDWLTLGNPAALQFGNATDFSFSMWYKADSPLSGTPAILSNQNLGNANAPGFTLFGNRDAGNQLGQRLTGATGTRREWDFIDINLGEWVFVSGVFDRSGNGALYVGFNGLLFKIAQNIAPLGNVNSALPWNIGQDGTHQYAAGLTAAVDELSVWRRELRDDEVRTLWAAGNVPPAPPLIAYPDSYTASQGLPLIVGAPGLLGNDVPPPVVLYSQNFDALPLGPAVEETVGDGTDFTHTPPAGWTVDRSGVPGFGTANNGVLEWAGWSFAAKDFWIAAAGDQNRSDFIRGNGTVAVADPDEWDDAPHPAGTYNTFMTTSAVSLAGMRANSLVLNFDSSFRFYGNMQGAVDVSFDNFATSTRIFTRLPEDLRNEAVSIPVNNPAGGSVRFRFGLTNAGNDWWWAVDNIAVAAVPTMASLTASLVTPPAHGTVVVNANGSFTYTPNATFVGTDQFTYAAGNGIDSTMAPVSITVTPRPAVAAVEVNDGSTQRSRVTSLSVAFNSVVTFATTPAAAFTLRRTSDNAAVTFAASVGTVNGVTVVTLTNFDGAGAEFGSLADGRYTLTALASQISAGGRQLDGNNDGTLGDDYVLAGSTANGLYRLYGDANGDGTVNAFDFSQFRNAFGSSTGQTAYLDWLDFNGDGVINAFDFSQFRNRFGGGVPFPSVGFAAPGCLGRGAVVVAARTYRRASRLTRCLRL